MGRPKEYLSRKIWYDIKVNLMLYEPCTEEGLICKGQVRTCLASHDFEIFVICDNNLPRALYQTRLQFSNFQITTLVIITLSYEKKIMIL